MNAFVSGTENTVLVKNNDGKSRLYTVPTICQLGRGDYKPYPSSELENDEIGSDVQVTSEQHGTIRGAECRCNGGVLTHSDLPSWNCVRT